jgi:hypothetical protein
MEPVCDFTLTEAFDRQRLLAEALEVVRHADVPMGKGAPLEGSARKSEAIQLLEKLEKEHAVFSPRLDVRLLTPEDHAGKGHQFSAELRGLLEDNAFYRVEIPITLFPLSGWAFTRLEGWVEFCPGEPDVHLRPVVHDLFPDDVWAEILSFQQSLSVGVDEDLQFRAEVEELKGRWQNLSTQAKARVCIRARAGARLVAGPFNYRFRRAEVRGRGRGGVQAFWRLDGKAHVDEEDVQLVVVLRVPRGRRAPLHAVGALKAYHDFQLWTSDIFRDWAPHFSAALKSLLGFGIPVTDQRTWSDIG